jgi:hypothetical protein
MLEFRPWTIQETYPCSWWAGMSTTKDGGGVMKAGTAKLPTGRVVPPLGEG